MKLSYGVMVSLVLLMYGAVVNAENRVALVIGNSDYADSPLKNPVNDAKAIAKALRQLNFKVIEKHNVKRKAFRRAVRAFGKSLSEKTVGLFYYAGHGMQIEGENYLIPVGSDISAEDEVADEAVSANLVLRKMESAKNDMNIVVLDACRNNPFARSFRSGSKGLSRMDGPTGSIIAFSTAPGDVAADGVGNNGLYTENLLKHLKKPGQSIERIFKKVRIDVRKQSNGDQIPWESSSLVRDFYFKESRGLKRVQVASAGTAELKFWDAVQANPDMDMYRLYLDKYPKGEFVSIAKLKVNKLGGADKGREELAKAENLYDVNKYNESFFWYKKAAEKGNMMAMSALSKLYFRGWGTNIDKEKSRQYGSASFRTIKKLAKTGNTKAQYYLGYMYSAGLGVKKDEQESMFWNLKAANKNHLWAMVNVGHAYENGNGVKSDSKKALKWYMRAADSGDAAAMNNIGGFYRDGKSGEKSYVKAMKWFKKAADKNSVFAMGNVGYLYYRGKGVDKDYKEAMKWYRAAAEGGHGYSMKKIADLYKEGHGVKKDAVKERQWRDKAKAKGY